ncbi:hypothetical protein P22_2099 [Propionispora sp. 2/2-37]|uniref:ribbon-helix-helix domain-containing protein n=1 Tax=Propionispora sp. 2/2-37 TaxID=1677858 RepID=UPI0006BB53DA|nr:ribbon-helix-helix domain-containing protein [Propionispora sp. 2/2-37]CUH96011.1 hypothetical protein P22_2099 [Propionispora sp. 2/2-37]
MAYNDLKYRRRFTTSIKNEILDAFFKLAAQKRQPKSWLMDEALTDLLVKHGMKIKTEEEENR